MMIIFTLMDAGNKELLPLITIVTQYPGKANEMTLDERAAALTNATKEAFAKRGQSRLVCALIWINVMRSLRSYSFIEMRASSEIQVKVTSLNSRGGAPDFRLLSRAPLR
ncbi:hypothetical protein ACU4GI_00970 [Cupriavidus basilensis]